MAASAKSTVNMSTVMRDISDALSLDRNDKKEEAYRKYLECVLRISTKLLKDLHAKGGHVTFNKEVTKFAKLGQQCMERATAIAAEQAAKGPAPSQVPDTRRIATPGVTMSLQAPPSAGIVTRTTVKAVDINSSTKKLTPTEMAVKHNQQLLAAYKARTEKNRSFSASQNLALTVQRKMAENLAIAKAREEALAKKMRERQKRLEEQAARRFHTPIGLSEEEQHQRQIYTKILEFEQEEIWMLDLRKQLEDSPDDVIVIYNLIEKVLCCETHPLTQQLKTYQEKTFQRIYQLVQDKAEQVNLVRVPLPRHLLSVLTKLQKNQINITTKIITKPKTWNEKTVDNIKTVWEEDTKHNSVQFSTSKNEIKDEDQDSVGEGLDQIKVTEESEHENHGDNKPNLPDFEALEDENEPSDEVQGKEMVKYNDSDDKGETGKELLEVSEEDPEGVADTDSDENAEVTVDNAKAVPVIEATEDVVVNEECSEENAIDPNKDAKVSEENEKENCNIQPDENNKTDTETAEMVEDEAKIENVPVEKETIEIDTNDSLNAKLTSEEDGETVVIKNSYPEISFKAESKVLPNKTESNKDDKGNSARKELVDNKRLDNNESSVDSSLEINLADTSKSIKQDLETAIVKGQQLKDKLERENSVLKLHARVSSIEIEKYNEENMDDLFDSDDEDEDDDSAFGSSFYSTVSGSWRTNSQISEDLPNRSRKPLSTQISKISSDTQSDVGISLESNESDTDIIVKTDNTCESDPAGSCAKDENANKKNSLTKNLSFQNLESAIKQLRNEAHHRHLKQITEDILTSIEKIQVLFVIGFEQLDTAEGRDQCNVLVEKHFFKPIWKYLRLLFRLANEPKEIAIAHMMTLKQGGQPEDFSVRQKLCLSSDAGDNSDYPYQAAVTELCSVVEKPTMLDKLDCLVKTSRLVLLCVDQYYEQKGKDVSEKPSIGADDLLPVLCYVVARCKLPEIVSECQAMERFIHEGYMYGEEGYCLTSFQTAINYLISEGMKSTDCETS